MSSTHDEHRDRVVQRATSDIASIIAGYRVGSVGFHPMVAAIEVRINSLIGHVDPEWLDEWRSHWNRLEYVNASMIDDQRNGFDAGEQEMVVDALDALESMTHASCRDG
jgi:hypothetical protein